MPEKSYTSKSIFSSAMVYIPKNSLDYERQCIAPLMEENGLQQFASLPPAEQRRKKDAADKIRQALLMELKKEPKAIKYTIIYDGLRLLAHCFPRNNFSDENMQYFECPITCIPLKKKSRYFVAADGYWFSLTGLIQLLHAHQGYPENLTNPYTTEKFMSEDIKRIKEIESEFVQDVAITKFPTFIYHYFVYDFFNTVFGFMVVNNFITTEKCSTNPLLFNAIAVGLLLPLVMFIRYKYHQFCLMNFSAASIFSYGDPEIRDFFYSLSPFTSQKLQLPSSKCIASLRSMKYALTQRLFPPHSEEKKMMLLTPREQNQDQQHPNNGVRPVIF